MRSASGAVAGLGHLAPDLLEREPRVALREDPRHLADLAPRHRLLEGQDAAHPPARLGRQHDERPLPLDRDEIDPLEPRVLERGREDDRGVVGQLGELRRRRLQEVVDLAPGARDLALEPERLPAAELDAPHQAVDVVPVRLVRRHAPRRGVGLAEVAHLLEVGHGVPDRRRREPQRVLLRQLAGADGLRRDGVLEQQGLEDLPRAVAQLVWAHHGLPTGVNGRTPASGRRVSRWQISRHDAGLSRSGAPAGRPADD